MHLNLSHTVAPITFVTNQFVNKIERKKLSENNFVSHGTLKSLKNQRQVIKTKTSQFIVKVYTCPLTQAP